MEPGAILALKRRSERRLLALHWSSLIAMAGLVIFIADRHGSYLGLVALLPVMAIALLGQGRAVRAPDFGIRRAALATWGSLMAVFTNSWILLIMVAVILVEGVRSWRNLSPRKSEVEERG